MKFLVVILVVALVLWLTSSRRVRHAPRRRDDAKAQQPLVQCAHCGVHLPRAEAVKGRDGRLFCGSAHALAAERGERAR